MIYSDVLTEVHRQLAAALGHRRDRGRSSPLRRLGAGLARISDSVEALQYLKQHYKLVILSNVDRASFAGSNRRLEVANSTRSTPRRTSAPTSPHRPTFVYMLDHGSPRSATARATSCTPRKACSTTMRQPRNSVSTSAWIDRRHDQKGWGATMQPPKGAAYEFRFPSLAAMVQAHKAELA